MKASVISKDDADLQGGLEPFDAQERQVLWLADTDPASSVPSIHDPLARLRSFLRGPQPSYRLANSRLETLRQSAIILRTGRALSGEELEAFGTAGYSRNQLDMLQILFANGRVQRELVDAA